MNLQSYPLYLFAKRGFWLVALLFLMTYTAEAATPSRSKQSKSKQVVRVADLEVEHLEEPLAIDNRHPRFSWRLYSEKQDVRQLSYQILVASSKEKLGADEGDLWNSGTVNSPQQIWITYAGNALRDCQQAFWKVRVVTNVGTTPWSAPARFGIGMLSETRWGGRWIGLERLMEGESRGLHTRLSARYFRREFKLKSIPVHRATAYIAGLGLYRLFINGKEVAADEVLKPSPADYRKTVYYNAYDVTAMLDTLTAVGVMVGNGRYFPMRQNKPYKTPVFGLPKCRLNILVEYADGSKEKIVTDERWKVTADGPIRANNEYDGEEYDARKELGQWTLPHYDDSRWMQAERAALPDGVLSAQMIPNMTAEKVTEAVRIIPVAADRQASSSARHIVDFGQNMAGWISVRPCGKAGDTIRIRYSEKLAADGSLYTANLRDARSEDLYICHGREQDSFTPSFVYHGFRYVEISGPVRIEPSAIVAYAVGDKMQRTGHFACSDTLLNRVISHAYWGIRSNYKGMPVDCPQRNERQPWLGDRTAGALGESFLFDNERLYAKWMRDICEAQRSDGNIPDVAPAFWNYYSDDVTWPAALPFICDMLYRQYGDAEPIRQSYASIRKWVNHITDEYQRDGIITRDKYGDWCMPPEKLELIHSEDPQRMTDGRLLSTAYLIRVMQLMERFASIAHHADEAEQWRQRHETMTSHFNRHFLNVHRGTSQAPGHVLYPDSIFYGNNSATANILPLAFGLVPDSVRSEVVKNLVTDIITRHQGHLSSGVIGISWLLTTLCDQGFADVAWLIATQRSYPSWGYMAEQGATTIWELWNGDKANPKMNSGNHVMLLGDLLPWAFSRMAGIRRSLEAGADGTPSRHFLLSPSWDVPDCEWVDASWCSPYGIVRSSWRKTLQHFEWCVELPCNTSATICLPDGTTKELSSGKHQIEGNIPTVSPMVVKDEFLYIPTTFPQCHASTIVETRKGDLVAAYFGGLYERHPEVCIYVSRKPKGSDKWEAPQMVADGVFTPGTPDADFAGIDSTSNRKACWNPVLYEMPDGELWLFFKIGKSVKDWTGWLVKSHDGGKTWSEKEHLPQGFLGPVKNKPEWVDGRLLCASSTENNGWKIHFEIYHPDSKAWKYVGPIEAEQAPRTIKPSEMKPIDCIQPSILRHRDGRLQVLCRTRNGRLATSFSSDGGEHWSKVELTDVPNNQSGTDAVTLRDGRQVLIYNDFATLPGTNKGPRTPLSIAVSNDGWHWQHLLTLEDSPISQYSYPSIIQGSDGSLHVVYTWRRQRVAYKKIQLK